MKQWHKFLAKLRGVKEPIPYLTQPRIYLTKELAETTARQLASFCDSVKQHEGISYWAGVPTDTAWVITTILTPKAHTTQGSYQTSVVANAQVITCMNDYRVQILAQLHGHPEDWVDHSAGDNHGAFMPYTGFYSIVVPYYGLRGLLPLTQCGIHRFQGNKFIRLSATEVDQQFIIVPTSIDLRTR